MDEAGRYRAFGVGRRVSSETNPMNETPSEGPGPVTRYGSRPFERSRWRRALGKSATARVLRSAHRGLVGMLLLQDEGDLEVDFVALYVAVLDQDVLVLDPSPLHAPESLGGAGYGLVDGVLEARFGDGAQFGNSRNAHGICVPPYARLLLMLHLWPDKAGGKPRGCPERCLGEVRHGPGPVGEYFSGSCAVTSRNSLIHVCATKAT